MFTLRQDQVDAFRPVLLAEFVGRMMDRLRKDFPDGVPAGPEGRRAVGDWTEDARRTGLEQEADVERYLELCAEFPDLRRRPAPPWAAAILGRRARPPADRLRDLEIELFFHRRTDSPRAG